MRKSYIAESIIQEYYREQKWKNKARQNCMNTTCDLCRYKYICEEVEQENNESSDK